MPPPRANAERIAALAQPPGARPRLRNSRLVAQSKRVPTHPPTQPAKPHSHEATLPLSDVNDASKAGGLVPPGPDSVSGLSVHLSAGGGSTSNSNSNTAAAKAEAGGEPTEAALGHGSTSWISQQLTATYDHCNSKGVGTI